MIGTGGIDAHVHLWRVDRGDYGWMRPEWPICRDYGLADLAPLIGDGRAVLVQAAPTEAETLFLLDLCRQSAGKVAGVVGWTDLAAADAPARVADMAGRAGLLGLRPMLQDIEETGWILRDDVAPGLAAMARAGLRFDALVQPRHLGLLPALARRHPDLAVVIDHAAKPELRSGEVGAWWRDIAAVARETGAFCKLSGLVTEAAPGWGVEILRPVVAHLFEIFGAQRLIWGSDWPVLTMNGSYAAWRAATLELVPEAAREAVLGGNAARFYGLERDGPIAR